MCHRINLYGDSIIGKIAFYGILLSHIYITFSLLKPIITNNVKIIDDNYIKHDVFKTYDGDYFVGDVNIITNDFEGNGLYNAAKK